jgi:hypothetical protein
VSKTPRTMTATRAPYHSCRVMDFMTDFLERNGRPHA